MTAKHYSEKKVSDWNVRNFTDYLVDEHKRRFNCDYSPFGSWAAERGRLGRAVGTTKKSGQYDKQIIKDFIDECFATYRPTQQFPGISFGFMLTYKQRELQAIQKRHNDRVIDEQEAQVNIDDLTVWFNN